MRRSCKADLVVHNHMHGAASFMANQARQAETFRNNTLTRKGRITMQQQWHNLCAIFVVLLFLFCAHLAQNNGVHRL